MPNKPGGKGSKQRPIKDKETFDKNWDEIFKIKPKYYPNSWVVIKISTKDGPSYYKIVCNFSYEDWRINSGISRIIPTETEYEIHGYSGSIYYCNKAQEHATELTSRIIDSIKKQLQETDSGEVTIIPMLEVFDKLL